MNRTLAAPLPAFALGHWQLACNHATAVTVLPDGCRDLIVVHAPGRRPEWMVTALFDAAVELPVHAGQRFAGLRLDPATRVDEAALCAAASRLEADDPLDLGALLEQHIRPDARLAEALSALAEGGPIAAICRRLGVSERSLERLLKQRTGRSPAYWRGLARARRAAVALGAGWPLAGIAADQGYADQAHMSRALRQWFGRTPQQLRADPALCALLREPGYG